MRSISASITSPGLRYSDAASGEKPATPDTVPVETHVAGRVAERRVVAEDLGDRHATCGPSATPAAPRRSRAAPSRDRAGRGSRPGVTIQGPSGQNVSIALQKREDARAHLAPLDVARRDVVEDHVAADVVGRILGREPLPGLRDDDRELELVVELLGQVLGVDDRLVGTDDRVDVLEEDDPGRDLVRPADLLRLLLVLAEVARRVEELLRDDRRAEARLGERRRARRSRRRRRARSTRAWSGRRGRRSPRRRGRRRAGSSPNETSFTRVASARERWPRAGAGSG